MAAIALSALTLHRGRGFTVQNNGEQNKVISSIPRFKKIYVTAPATADDGDTFDVDVRDFGCTKIMGIFGFIHTTTDSVIVEEAPTTATNSSVITVTVGGSTDNKKRFYIIYAV